MDNETSPQQQRALDEIHRLANRQGAELSYDRASAIFAKHGALPPAPSVDQAPTAGLSSRDRMNIFTQPYIPEHNAAILATPKVLLGGGLLSQRQYVLRMLTSPMPCPSCGRRISCAEAAGGLLNIDLRKGDTGREYRCTGCFRPLHYGLPLMGDPFWSIDHAREALEKRQGAALDTDSSQAAPAPRYVKRPPGDGE